ncbi:hypothetical protein LCGC14_1866210 [marine sediment metagenome]|uniref:Uncharacterized protein n=1 Tax=marine sediment metagenome TaxID=412755 RepID=A0A0F9G6G2_9ZZZZ
MENKTKIYYRESRWLYLIYLMAIGISIFFELKGAMIFIMFALFAVVISQNEARQLRTKEVQKR